MISKYKTDEIAILISTYNGAKYIGEQIDSLLAQTNQHFEIYIHDDGSIDDTVEILNCYQLKFENIHLVDSKNHLGIPASFFYLLNIVDAQYYMFCDQDDVWDKDKIENEMVIMQNAEEKYSNEMPILVHSDLKVVDENLKLISDSLMNYQTLDASRVSVNYLMVQNVVTGCTVMINSSLKHLCEATVVNNSVIMHDWWIALVAAIEGKIIFCNEGLVLYRQHQTNEVGAKKIYCLNYILRKIKNYKENKVSIEKTRMQARYFFEVYKKNDLISCYADSSNYCYIHRIYFYIKNKIYKCGIVRNFGFLLWC